MCVFSICRKLDRPTKRYTEKNKLETSSGLIMIIIMYLTFASTLPCTYLKLIVLIIFHRFITEQFILY